MIKEGAKQKELKTEETKTETKKEVEAKEEEKLEVISKEVQGLISDFSKIENAPVVAEFLDTFDLEQAKADPANAQFLEKTKNFSTDQQASLLKSHAVLQYLQSNQNNLDKPEVQSFISQNTESLQALSTSYNAVAEDYGWEPVNFEYKETKAQPEIKAFSNPNTPTVAELADNPEASMQAMESLPNVMDRPSK